MQNLYLALLIIPCFIWVDSVETSDGSLLRGKILGMVDGNLTIKPPLAEKLKFPTPRLRPSTAIMKFHYDLMTIGPLMD